MKPEILGGIRVGKIEEVNEKATWFTGTDGILYRYLNAYRKSWPVDSKVFAEKEKPTNETIPFPDW